MPIKINKRTFRTFAEAVRYVMEHKKMDKQSANAYVAEIERRQKGKRKN